ncbi:hypothetical protein [Trichocoleus sp. FACHB-90]|uniref:hypothetical protein n=1 Tax=Trichocoleus sp. FACHB-90 TaxID=2692876 RepID=UPI001A7EB53A|nr:hypothetical protein [Trichocoleus sp. FACHB-90]
MPSHLRLLQEVYCFKGIRHPGERALKASLLPCGVALKASAIAPFIAAGSVPSC